MRAAGAGSAAVAKRAQRRARGGAVGVQGVDRRRTVSRCGRVLGGDVPARPLHVLDRRRVGEDRPVGHSASEIASDFGPPHAGRHRRRGTGAGWSSLTWSSCTKRPWTVSSSPASRLPHGGRSPLRSARAGEAGQRADLAHPLCDAVAHAGLHPAGVQPPSACELHRQRHRVAHRRGADAESDFETSRSVAASAALNGGDPAGPEALLPQPQLVEARRPRHGARSPAGPRVGAPGG